MSSVQSSAMSREAHDEAEVVRELEPGGDVAVVVEPRARRSRRPRCSSRPAARESAKLSVVMFAPKPHSAGVAAEEARRRRRARGRRPRSVRRLVS